LLSYRYSAVRKWLEPPRLAFIKKGQLQRRHLSQEMITEEELLSHLRQQNLEDYSQANLCYLESDGQISVIQQVIHVSAGHKSNRLCKNQGE